MSSPIKITHVQQRKRNWCWAACCEMLAKRCGIEKNQDYFAIVHNDKFHHGLDHMASGAETAWVLRNHAGLSVDYLRHIGLNRDPKLTWAEVCAATNLCRVIIAGAANHAWIIAGYDNDPVHGNVLWIHDPSRDLGPNKAKWDVFQARWVDTVILSKNDVHVLD